MRNDPAFPYKWDFANGNMELNYGLTKREYFAGQIMIGVLSQPQDMSMSNAKMASWAVKVADALIEELSK